MKNVKTLNPFSSIRNRQGVTLVEALLAMGLVAVIALGSLSYFSDVSKFSSRMGETCRLHNLSFLNQLRTYGTMSSIWNYFPTSTLDYALNPSVASSKSFQTPDQVSASSRWPGDAVLGTVDVTAAPTQYALINNYLLINGNMNVIQAIYNANPAICSGFRSIGSAPDTFKESSLLTPNPTPTELDVRTTSQTTVQIVPYDLSTGNYLTTCPSKVKIAPRGKYLNDDNATGNSPFKDTSPDGQRLTRPADVSTNLGFAVRVKTEYTNEKGLIEDCRTEQRFQYDIDTEPPIVPQDLNMTLTSAPPATCSAANINDYKLEIGYTSNLEPGTVLLCKDLSVLPKKTKAFVDGKKAEIIKCYNDITAASGEAPPGPQPAIDDTLSSYYPSATGTTGVFDYASPLTVVLGPTKWVPCYQMTLCGVAPATSTAVSAVTSPSTGYSIVYKNLPSDCRVAAQVIAVDTAANASVIKNSIGKTALDANDSNVSSWDVPRPKCRFYCPITSFPDGYFTCRMSGC